MSILSQNVPKTQSHKLNELRRSQRVLIRLAVKVSGNATGGNAFSEDSTTLVVNAHGALILLESKVAIGQALTISNSNTREKLACRVASMGPANSGKTEVGIGFMEPAPFFWRIAFPPADWGSRTP
jgi:hypothetical protein